MENGGEYVSKDVEHIYFEVGIQLQHMVLYTPQQNMIAERKNWSLKDMVNCMLNARSLPSKLWAEEKKYATYLQNRVPHKSLKGMTPFETRRGNQPKVTHLHIFGSGAWDHIP
jgi:hypothetical protein